MEINFNKSDSQKNSASGDYCFIYKKTNTVSAHSFAKAKLCICINTKLQGTS